MSTEKLLSWFVANTPSVIQYLFIAILSLIGVLLFLSFRNKKSSDVANTEGLEETLRKVLENTQHMTARSATENTSQAGADTASGVAADGVKAAGDAKLEAALKAQLTEREKQIAELTNKLTEAEKKGLEVASAAASAQAAAASGDSTALEAKIKDLEARLKEYEIIEDDIANLSLYKEENVRLKNELNKLKGMPAVEDIVTPDATALASEDKSMAEALQQAAAENNIESVIAADLAAPSATAAAAEPEPEQDLVSQLASVVGGEAPSTNATEVAAPTPAAAAPAAAAPTPAPAAEESIDSLMSFDPDKIAEEAGNLKVDPTQASAQPEEEGDVGQKLIDEFENFMKDS